MSYKVIGKNTKTGQGLLWAYDRAQWRELTEVYKNPSPSKIDSFLRIKRCMENCGGWGLKITGYNCMCYSCAFLYRKEDDGKLTLAYFTAYNTYDVILED